jgi:CcmD family protein
MEGSDRGQTGVGPGSDQGQTPTRARWPIARWVLVLALLAPFSFACREPHPGIGPKVPGFMSVLPLEMRTALALTATATLAFQDKGFVPVQPGETGQETLPATPLVFVAYAFVWLALLTYVGLLWRRLARVERELADVRAKLQTRG